MILASPVIFPAKVSARSKIGHHLICRPWKKFTRFWRAPVLSERSLLIVFGKEGWKILVISRGNFLIPSYGSAIFSRPPPPLPSPPSRWQLIGSQLSTSPFRQNSPHPPPPRVILNEQAWTLLQASLLNSPAIWWRQWRFTWCFIMLYWR